MANNIALGLDNADERKPTLLLNAHIDTVKAVDSWTKNPYQAEEADGKIYGLGSNDCGGGLVSLLETYRLLQSQEQPYNAVFLASAEEEVSGERGFRLAKGLLPKVDVAIVGEPTGMLPAIAEKGLMVLDVRAYGKSGHAARNEGVNAIYKMLNVLQRIRSLKFCKTSPLLKETLLNITMIQAGTQHNVVPDLCSAVIDIRTNEMYSNEEVFLMVKKAAKEEAEVSARSFRLSSSHIDPGHTLVRRLESFGLKPFGSPTLSDQALMSFPSLKLGPGSSARSHTADEYIKISEINDALNIYERLLFKQSIV